MNNSGKMTIEFRIEVVVESDADGFHAYCPSLKGLHVGGDTKEEALQNARDAAIAYLHSLIKHGDPVPLSVVVREKVEHLPHTRNASYHTEDLEVACV